MLVWLVALPARVSFVEFLFCRFKRFFQFRNAPLEPLDLDLMVELFLLQPFLPILGGGVHSV